MVKQQSPLFSAHATGLLRAGLQIATRPRGYYLTRSHTPTTRYSRSQLSLRTFVAMLAQAWHEWSPILPGEWSTHPLTPTHGAYHAYLIENHTRRQANQWPIIVYNTPASGTPPGPGAKIFYGLARALAVRMLTMTGNHAVFVAGFVLPYTYGLVRPMNVQAWSYESITAKRNHLIRHVEPGTYTAQWFFIDGFGQLSVPCGGSGIVVTP